MFASDRDLLVYEPRLFLDAGWLGQRLVLASGGVVGGVATAAGVNMAAVGVQAGGVLSYTGASFEVVSVLGTGGAVVSRLRASVTDAALPTPDVASQTTLEVVTFRPQLAVVHGQLLRMLGIEPQDAREGALTESAVVNPGSLTRLECLGALHLIYAAAAAAAAPGGLGAGLSYGERALMYRERFAAERLRVSVLIDADGDGEPEVTRRPGVGFLVRG
jgi:hypothetical protein